MYLLFAKEFGCVPIKWQSEYARLGFFQSQDKACYKHTCYLFAPPYTILPLLSSQKHAG